MPTPFAQSVRRAAHATLALLALGTTAAATAGCTRDIVAPMSPLGVSVLAKGGSLSGIFPDLLRSLGDKAGCRFTLPVVPRARLEAMFANGQADLLAPAVRTPQRDLLGHFVPVASSRPTLITLEGEHAPVRSAQELLERREIRVAVVRGFDYGPAYVELIKGLTAQGRLFLEVDVVSVARLLQAGFIDATIMAPTVLSGTVQTDKRTQDMNLRLRLEPLPELPWSQIGIYISKQAVGPDDLATLQEMLEKGARSGRVLEAYQHYHSSELLTVGIRPR